MTYPIDPSEDSLTPSAATGYGQSPWGSPTETDAPLGATTAQPPRQRTSVPLGGAVAMALVAAIAAGGITGVAAVKMTDNAGPVVSSLEQGQPAASVVPAQPGSVEEVAQKVLPAVVSIRVVTGNAMGEGSGSIITSDGMVVTNNHVVEGAQAMEVTLNNGDIYEAELVGRDASTDVAVIKLQRANGLPTISMGNSEEVRVGQQVVAVGSPLGLTATVTSGIVSALNRPVRAAGSQAGESSLIDAIQTDAAINPGNSGGPLVDMAGNLVGMNSMIASMSNQSPFGGAQEAGSIGLGFAIPVNQLRRYAQQLIDTGKVTQPMLGISLSDDNRYDGALVAQIDPNGPSADSGLKPGDIITQLGDRRIDSADALIAAVRSQEFGATVTLHVRSADSKETHAVEVTLTSE
ncbi:MAG: trypsin-like peptidase domain-containing protein [Corynebacterium sp.]|nr:trypsin-like peptidase domain-containing protein [Corynebacterium sp.]